MGFNPRDQAIALRRGILGAHSNCVFLASQQVLPVRETQSRVQAVSIDMASAHTALQTLQAAFSNAQIASRYAELLEPPPADLAAAYVSARAAVHAMLDDYGATVLSAMGSAWTWDAVNRVHIEATFDIDTPANFKANLIAARDALEPLA